MKKTELKVELTFFPIEKGRPIPSNCQLWLMRVKNGQPEIIVEGWSCYYGESIQGERDDWDISELEEGEYYWAEYPGALKKEQNLDIWERIGPVSTTIKVIPDIKREKVDRTEIILGVRRYLPEVKKTLEATTQISPQDIFEAKCDIAQMAILRLLKQIDVAETEQMKEIKNGKT